jgi:DNA polymerase
VHVPLANQVDIAGFHSEATRLLGQQVPPQQVEWSAEPSQSVEEEPLEAVHAAIRNRAARAIIPQSFVRMSELVVLHRAVGRFDLLYRSLWRLVYEPELKNHQGDEDLLRLRQMAQAVRRDIQKMKTKLQFRPLLFKGEAIGVAWYEPTHYVCETVAAVLAKRDLDHHWVLLTPDRSLRWDGHRLLSAPAVASHEQPGEAADDAAWTRVLEALPWA